jgi:hypothetical protein
MGKLKLNLFVNLLWHRMQYELEIEKSGQSIGKNMVIVLTITNRFPKCSGLGLSRWNGTVKIKTIISNSWINRVPLNMCLLAE